MARRDVLISGGGIAGLTLAILLKQQGFEPLVVEREPALPAEGYMMDFFGTGWDVAERMGLVEELRAIRYPIDTLQFVDSDGSSLNTVPISRIRRALDHKYVYLRRTDLARVLHDRARSAGVEIHFGESIQSLEEFGDEARVLFEGGGRGVFSLVFGADGIHSRVRELVFGPEHRFDRFLGYYVAAFHIAGHDYDIGRTFKLYEEPNRLLWLYPLGERRLDATCVFRHADAGRLPAEQRLSFIKENYAGGGWLAERVFTDHPDSQPLYFDAATQIVMPDWHKGRVALLGDACGALTLLAGQGSHMAMAGAYVLAQELARHGGDHRAAFAAYQAFVKPHVEQKQRDAAWLSRMFVPTDQSWPWLRRLVIRLILSAPLARFTMAYSGAGSVLKGYPSS
jgi:2-polyprenyl-6-methoxyphenol hydroxylase-like FAD-dependent oxidoreductase